MVKIDSAHSIEKYIGKCHRLHGHTWKILILEKFDKLDDRNIARDYNELPKEQWVWSIVKWLDEELDHKYLNEVFNEPNLTSEFLAREIWKKCLEFGAQPGEFSVLVQEGDGGVCVYDGDKWWLGKI